MSRNLPSEQNNVFLSNPESNTIFSFPTKEEIKKDMDEFNKSMAKVMQDFMFLQKETRDKIATLLEKYSDLMLTTQRQVGKLGICYESLSYIIDNFFAKDRTEAMQVQELNFVMERMKSILNGETKPILDQLSTIALLLKQLANEIKLYTKELSEDLQGITARQAAMADAAKKAFLMATGICVPVIYFTAGLLISVAGGMVAGATIAAVAAHGVDRTLGLKEFLALISADAELVSEKLTQLEEDSSSVCLELQETSNKGDRVKIFFGHTEAAQAANLPPESQTLPLLKHLRSLLDEAGEHCKSIYDTIRDALQQMSAPSNRSSLSSSLPSTTSHSSPQLISNSSSLP